MGKYKSRLFCYSRQSLFELHDVNMVGFGEYLGDQTLFWNEPRERNWSWGGNWPWGENWSWGGNWPWGENWSWGGNWPWLENWSWGGNWLAGGKRPWEGSWFCPFSGFGGGNWSWEAKSSGKLKSPLPAGECPESCGGRKGGREGSTSLKPYLFGACWENRLP